MTFKKLDLQVDVLPLQNKLKDKDYLFGQYPMRGDFEDSPHKEMKDIWVRYNDAKPYLESEDWSTFGDEHDSIWYPSYRELPEVKDIVFKVMSHVYGERLGGILITKLPSGGKIHKHTDSGWHAAYYDKYYVPIENYDGSTFSFNSGTISPKLGEVYWFDNSKPHWVDNNSDGDRIAMIVCIRTDRGEE